MASHGPSQADARARRPAILGARAAHVSSEESANRVAELQAGNSLLDSLRDYKPRLRNVIMFIFVVACVLVSFHVMNREPKVAEEKFAICGNVKFKHNGTTHTCYKRTPDTNEIEPCRHKICSKRCVAATCSKARGEQIERLNDQILKMQAELKKNTADHATELKQIKADHATELKKNKADHATELKQIKANHATELKKNKADHATELKQIKADHATELQTIKVSHKSKMDAIHTQGCASAPMIKKTIKKYHEEMASISKEERYKTVVFPNCKDKCNDKMDHDALDNEQHAFFWCVWYCVNRHIMLTENDFHAYAIVQGKEALETARADMMQFVGNEPMFRTQTINNNSIIYNNNFVVMSPTPCLAGKKGRQCRLDWEEQFKALKEYCKYAPSNVKNM